MKILGLDHVGIAVSDKESACRFFTEVIGAKIVVEEDWTFKDQHFSWTSLKVGGHGMLEIISSKDPFNFINRFIEKHGEGLHHLTFQVENLEEAIRELDSKGIKVIDVNVQNPYWKEAYIKPSDSFGVLIQLAEFDEQYWESKANK
ncbi:MAG: VOC family protein [Actinomycetota bacterium]|nr:VOC family protein [Actinomycetota bacterium]